jgi:hypothetical protein
MPIACTDYDKAVELNSEEPTYYIARAKVLDKMKLASAARRDREVANEKMKK